MFTPSSWEMKFIYIDIFQETNEEIVSPGALNFRRRTSHKDRQQIADVAKAGVRNRRGRRMQVSDWSHEYFGIGFYDLAPVKLLQGRELQV